MRTNIAHNTSYVRQTLTVGSMYSRLHFTISRKRMKDSTNKKETKKKERKKERRERERERIYIMYPKEYTFSLLWII